MHGQLMVDGIRALVDDQVITNLEVKQAAAQTVRILEQNYHGPDLPSRLQDAELNALKALIETKLILTEFKRSGGQIPEIYINQRLDDTIRNDYNGDRVAFIKTLEARGITMSKARKDIADSTIAVYMRSRQVGQASLVSPYQVEKYYQDNLKKYTTDEQLDVSKIFLTKSATPSYKTGPNGQQIAYDPKRELADQIVSQLYAGAKFEDLAKQYSESDDKDAGGEMGMRTKTGVNALREDLWEPLIKLQPGQFTDVIETADGYYFILKLNDRKLPSIAKIEEVRPDIDAAVLEEEQQKRYEDWLDRLRAKAYIKIF